MTIANRYIRRSRISEAKFREFVKCFSLDLDARQTALLTGLNRNTVNRYLFLLRTRIAEFCEQSSPFQREVEADDSCFRAKRIEGNPGHGAYSKTPVFGILQQSGMLYTEIVPDGAKQTFQAVIRGKVEVESLIQSGFWRGYHGLVDLANKKHYRVPYGNNELANGKSQISSIESFWAYAKGRLMKFHGIPKTTFYLHLKESEFRFNYRNQDIYQLVLKMLREDPLS